MQGEAVDRRVLAAVEGGKRLFVALLGAAEELDVVKLQRRFSHRVIWTARRNTRYIFTRGGRKVPEILWVFWVD
jgi:hypothetical protein